MWTYERQKPAADFQRLIDRIKSGHISVPLNALCICQGAAPAELVLRGMYYPGRIERAHDVRFRLVYLLENQTQPPGRGLAVGGLRRALVLERHLRLRHAGAPGRRPRARHLPLGRAGRSGRADEVEHAAGGDHRTSPTRAWAATPRRAFPRRSSRSSRRRRPATASRARYPYNVIGAFGQGWDDVQTMNQLIVDAAKAHDQRRRAM